MPRLSHEERTERIEALICRFESREFLFSIDVLSASLYALGIRGDELKDLVTKAIELRSNADENRVPRGNHQAHN